jgi:hypothetical protein
MKSNLTTFLLLVLLSNTACSTFKTEPVAVPTSPVSHVTAANRKADASISALDRKLLEQASKLRVNVDAARIENQANPEGHPKTIVDMELGIAHGRLASVEPDSGELLRASQAKTLIESGKAEEARKTAAIATSEAVELAVEITKAQKDRDTAILERNQAQIAFQKEMESNRLKNQKTLDDLVASHKEELDEERKSFLRMMGRTLVGAGIVLILIGAFVVYAGVQSGNVFKSGIKAAVFAGSAGFCFACAWTINQWWFKWVVIGGGGLAIIGLGLFLWAEWKENAERKTRFTEADEAEDTLKKISSVLDKMPKDSPLFAQLGDTMDSTNKALILELKAEDKRKTT